MRPSGHALFGAGFHAPRRKLAGQPLREILHDENSCFLCGTALPDKSPTEAIGEVGGFHVAVGDEAHTGALCYSCWFPAGFGRKVEAKIRERQVGEQMELFR